jgi:Tat protein secretion system quality control protein TatD with DNase activity
MHRYIYIYISKCIYIYIDLASEVCLPMFLHNRNTGGEFLKMVTEERSKMKSGGIVYVSM